MINRLLLAIIFIPAFMVAFALLLPIGMITWIITGHVVSTLDLFFDLIDKLTTYNEPKDPQ